MTKISGLPAVSSVTGPEIFPLVVPGSPNVNKRSTAAQILAYITASLGTAAQKNTGTSAGQVPILDGGGLLDTSVLPPLAITKVNVVASQVAMLALTAQEGDVAVRTDLNKSYILSTNSPSTLADWKELLTPTEFPWTNWTPTISMTSVGGTPIAATITHAKYKILDKLLFVDFSITVTSVGVGNSGLLTLSWPVSPASGASPAGTGYETTLTGKPFGMQHTTVLNLKFFDATAILGGGNGSVYVGSCSIRLP